MTAALFPRRIAVLLAAVLLPFLSACTGQSGGSGDEEEAATPEEVLTQAKTTIEETPGLRLALSTDALPSGVSGILAADGVTNDSPAFEGDLTVALSGQSVEVPVVAVDGKVYAQLPFTSSFEALDPGAYGAPDPATLLDPDTGFPALLTSTQDPEEGESVRGGADNTEVLTEYTGTVTGSDMEQVIPSSSGESFDVTWQVTDQGELRRAELTGEFYPTGGDMTYTVDFTDYGTEQQISRP